VTCRAGSRKCSRVMPTPMRLSASMKKWSTSPQKHALPVARPQRRSGLCVMVVATGGGEGVAMRVYLKAVAITVGLLGAWLALLPLVA
jgi:hypothetical protein